MRLAPRVLVTDTDDYERNRVGPIHSILDECVQCGVCQKHCGFLKRYGDPKAILEAMGPMAPDEANRVFPYECNLCRLCASVCPRDCSAGDAFLFLRRRAVSDGQRDLKPYGRILAYERRGHSPRYSWYAIPRDSRTVLFPGCALVGTRPHKVMGLWRHLRKSIPDLGVVLDCCGRISHDLGRVVHFEHMFGQMLRALKERGIERVLTACPSCFDVFQTHAEGLQVETVYELMAEGDLPEKPTINGTVTVQDPCVTRFEGPLHEAVRQLIMRKGLDVREMRHHGRNTLCCGEGGAVRFESPELARHWGQIRQKESQGMNVLTYCAGCAAMLRPVIPIFHVVDLLFEPEATLRGKARVSRAPLTYWNRLRVKGSLKNGATGYVYLERDRSGEVVERRP